MADRPVDPLAQSMGEGWHPEPELLDVRDEARSRLLLELMGEAAWTAALDYVYEHGLERAIGEPADYHLMRSEFFGPSGQPAAAPTEPVPSEALIDEFRVRLAPHQANACHPRAYAYFTPVPLWASIVGELFSQVAHQGVDVWHCDFELAEESNLSVVCFRYLPDGDGDDASAQAAVDVRQDADIRELAPSR